MRPAARLEQGLGARQLLRRQRRISIDVLPVELEAGLIGFGAGRVVVIDALQRLNRSRRLPGSVGREPQSQPRGLRPRELPGDERFVDRDRALEVFLRFAGFGLQESGVFGQVPVDLARGQFAKHRVGCARSARVS